MGHEAKPNPNGSRSLGRIDRRGFIAGSAGLLAASAAHAAKFATPAQTQGPFYPFFRPLDSDADLTLLKGATGPAKGEVIDVVGRVFSLAGERLADAVVEIWQADSRGRYNHPLDISADRDKNFQGFGAVKTDREGAYRFRTVRPRYYETGIGRRTPHIHFYVEAPKGLEVTTQMYFPNEPLNDTDFVRARLTDEAQRAAVTARLEQGEVPRYVFDIILG